MNRRDQLLAGITSLNREEFDAREDSEEATTNVGAGVEGELDERELGTPGDSGPRVQADKGDIQTHEACLEDLMRAQVVSKYTARDALKLAISDTELKLADLRNREDDLDVEIDIIEGVLNAHYARAGSAKSPIPTKGPGRKVKAKEKS